MKTIRSMPELIAAMKARAAQLDLSYQTIDHVAGLQSGYTGKLFGPNPAKGLGPMSFEALLGALAIGIVVIEDPDQEKRVSRQWSKRKMVVKNSAEVQRSASILSVELASDLVEKIERRRFFKMIGSKGGKRRMVTMKRRARQRAAAHAARKRWAKPSAGGF